MSTLVGEHASHGQRGVGLDRVTDLDAGIPSRGELVADATVVLAQPRFRDHVEGRPVEVRQAAEADSLDD